MSTDKARHDFEAYASTEQYYRHDFTLFGGGTVKGRTYLDTTTELAFRAYCAALSLADEDGWRQFGAKVLQFAREGMGDVDGGSIQDWALEAGLLEMHQEFKPCGEGCRCAEYVICFPWECYRYSDKAKATIDAIAAPTSAKEEGNA